MPEVTPDQLQTAVESLHECTAVLSAVVEVHEKFDGETVWHGTVHVFSVTGVSDADTVYAWSSPVEGKDTRRFFAVKRVDPVFSPSEAVRAAILADHGPHKRMSGGAIES